MKQIIASGVVALLMNLSTPAAAEVPTDQLKHSTDRVLQLGHDELLQKTNAEHQEPVFEQQQAPKKTTP